jgi:hypothetical protein
VNVKKGILIILLGVLAAYVLGAVITFDFSHNACPLEENYYPNGRIVILGPKPRGVFCRPALGEVHYNGTEWPFAIYRPVCQFWKNREKNYLRVRDSRSALRMKDEHANGPSPFIPLPARSGEREFPYHTL